VLQRLYFTLLVFAVSFCSRNIIADEVDEVFDYAYSVFVGTGIYTIQDRTTYIFRAPLEFDIYELGSGANRKVGLKLLAPVTIGLTDYGNLEELPELDVNDIQAISFVPGLEMPILLNEHWQLKPFAQAGFGVDIKSDAESFIWGTGVRTRATYGEEGKWILGGEFLLAGHNPNKGAPSTTFDRWGLGLEYKIPSGLSIFDRSVSWHLRAFQWYFSDPVVFRAPPISVELNHISEVGLSFGLDRPIKMLGYNFTQLGVGYEWSTDYKAITFFTTFPF
jgi:hypothetical protein